MEYYHVKNIGNKNFIKQVKKLMGCDHYVIQLLFKQKENNFFFFWLHVLSVRLTWLIGPIEPGFGFYEEKKTSSSCISVVRIGNHKSSCRHLKTPLNLINKTLSMIHIGICQQNLQNNPRKFKKKIFDCMIDHVFHPDRLSGKISFSRRPKNFGGWYILVRL